MITDKTKGVKNELALFAGAGGGILGGLLLGWRTICAVEIDPYCRNVLLARQNDGSLPPFPVWDDVRTFDGKQWRGIVDVVSGGFPCQDISCAGKGAGIEGKRSGLWGEMARIIGEVRPRFAFVENSPMLVGRGLAVVLGDLAEMRYDARWCVLGADDVGAPHKRKRIWILGYADSESKATLPINEKMEGMQEYMANTQNARIEAQKKNMQRCNRGGDPEYALGSWWQTEPNVGRVVDGVDFRVDRLKALGNGQVPQCAAMAWRILSS
jgi:DNA (cytosine-5)-methyltransferase 1